MPSNEPKSVTDNWYVRLNMWNNRIGARLVFWVAACVSWFARFCRGEARERIEALTRFCRNLARYIARPETARLMASPGLLGLALVETCGFTVLLTLATAGTLISIYGFLVIDIIPVLLLVIVLTFVFTHLIYLLALSGDVYQKRQDENQRRLAHQASAAALRFMGGVLTALSLCLALLPAWRAWVAIDLSVLLLLARLLYLARLAQLRWSVLALASFEDEDMEPARLVEE
jgi:hypothetical protein